VAGSDRPLLLVILVLLHGVVSPFFFLIVFRDCAADNCAAPAHMLSAGAVDCRVG
jgi:hypothetical protein